MWSFWALYLTAALEPLGSSDQVPGDGADLGTVRAIRPYRALNRPLFGALYGIMRPFGPSWNGGLIGKDVRSRTTVEAKSSEHDCAEGLDTAKPRIMQEH